MNQNTEERIPPEDEGYAWLIVDLETGEFHMRDNEAEAFSFAQILGGEPFRENVRCPTPALRIFGRDANGEPETKVIMTLEKRARARWFAYGS